MRIACRPCVLVLCILLATYALAEGSWDRVRYCGGSVQSDIDPNDWNNHLNISLEHIVLELNDGTKVDIPAKSVTGVSYGQQAHSRISAVGKVKVQASQSESVIFGLGRTRLHFIGIEYRPPDGKSSGLLLQGNKENYRAILKALEAATGASVAALEKDREYLADAATPVKESKPPVAKPVDQPKPVVAKPADQPKTPVVTPTNAATGKPIKTGTVSINSSPRAATVTVDGVIMGNTPSSLKLPPGEHSISLSLGGYKDWVTSVTVEAGNTVSVKANLAKQ
jgi:hypothetical protein